MGDEVETPKQRQPASHVAMLSLLIALVVTVGGGLLFRAQSNDLAKERAERAAAIAKATCESLKRGREDSNDRWNRLITAIEERGGKSSDLEAVRKLVIESDPVKC